MFGNRTQPSCLNSGLVRILAFYCTYLFLAKFEATSTFLEFFAIFLQSTKMMRKKRLKRLWKLRPPNKTPKNKLRTPNKIRSETRNKTRSETRNKTRSGADGNQTPQILPDVQIIPTVKAGKGTFINDVTQVQ